MKIIGLTGGSGSGKSTVARLFSARGISVFDCDNIYHELVDSPSPCVDALCQAFGEGIRNPKGALDRRALAAIVFSEGADEKRRLLNRITHAFVIERIDELCSLAAKNNVPAVIIDAPLLFESGLDRRCDLTVAVIASEDKRISRLTLRDGISEEAARRRIRAQLSDAEFSDRCDVLISNDGEPSALAEQVDNVLSRFVFQ